METKSFALGEVKALGDQPGSFEAIVSVFGNVDSYGDRMVKGAFARTLTEKGMPPVVWSHEWQVPPIGTVETATETDEGLLIKGRLFTGPDEGHAVAQQVYTAMKAGALKEFSFGYSTKASNDVTEGGKTIREITDVDLFEVGPTLVGANSETRLVGIKALAAAAADELEAVEVKAGRVLSKANETKLRDAADLMAEVLASVGDPQAQEDVAEEAAPKNFDGDAVEKKDSPADKEPTKDPADAVSEESATRIAAVLLARPTITIPQED